MNWTEQPIPADDEGQPMFLGRLMLSNDKSEKLGGVVWFHEEGPFYSHAMDVRDTTRMARIGPCYTLEGAKQSVIDAIEGRLDIHDRAGYRR